ncbi:hypothetical protein CNZW441b_a0030 (plasmid) [Campylobacter novaezeelandiae]|uniref:hypothetical protein n=1 Tax=Campylobacter novaezeelandiae TaxID=2267891 RepID=UPI001C1E609A|nr:hypothetical protein [Campylobacter novaezeelandiae]QWU80828.1 hypothetical protein CNZW441b_a0030 [Campylobacter novaezeelandiae]
MNNLPKEVQQAHELIDNTLKLLEKENARIAETTMEFKEENLENLNREITQFKKMKENRHLNEIKLMDKSTINIICDMNEDLKKYNLELENSEAIFYKKDATKITIPELFEESLENARNYKIDDEYEKLIFGDDEKSKAFQNEIKEQMELENIDFNDNETSKNKSFFLEKMKNFFRKNDQKNKELER